MHEITKAVTVTNRTRNLRVTVAAAVASGLALVNSAMAQATDPLAGLNTQDSGGVSGIVATVLTIAGVCLTIGLVVWGVRHLKPKG